MPKPAQLDRARYWKRLLEQRMIALANRGARRLSGDIQARAVAICRRLTAASQGALLAKLSHRLLL